MKFGSALPPISVPSHKTTTPPLLVSRFRNLPGSVVQQIQNSPELQKPHIQELLKEDTLEIRFQGKTDESAEIVTAGKAPQKYILDGLIKAALVNLGFSGKQVIPQDEPGDLFVKSSESQN